ncbi:MAG TPA: hypothetical protein VH593_21880, partial [Ktedonobacteraceae bacterium]
ELLKAWVTAPIDMSFIRDELVLKAFSIWLADPQAAITLFSAHEQLHQQQLEHFEEVQQKFASSCAEQEMSYTSPQFGTYVTLKCGIEHEQAYIRWCRWVVEQLEQANTTE